MAASQDTEITLGTGKLLLLFFSLVGICALFFALGYTLGRKSEPAITTASAAMPQTAPTTAKPASAAAPAMTFYKAVEQKDANPELTPATDAKSDSSSAPASDPSSAPPAASNANDTTTLPSTASYFVQVAAVSKQEDAASLVDALKKKNYPAFVAPTIATDKLFRVQVGPFTEVKDAEAMRTRLISDGYSPILKR